MTRITVIGGTGYTGGNIVQEAVKRGHSVISYSRNAPKAAVPGVQYETGSLIDPAVQQQAFSDTDVVIASLAPRGELEDSFQELYRTLAQLAAEKGVRFGVIGGFGSLRPTEGAERFADSGSLPAEYGKEPAIAASVVKDLLASAPETLDWFFLSPAANYGAHAPGETRGTYRVGSDVALFDENGESAISGTDFATAVVDEIEKPAHHRAHFSVAY